MNKIVLSLSLLLLVFSCREDPFSPELTCSDMNTEEECNHLDNGDSCEWIRDDGSCQESTDVNGDGSIPTIY